MSERKSINKYYPPDYNPIEAENALYKSSKSLKTKNKESITIRLMTPFSMRCLKCSEYIAKSRKFNGKKEVLKERYLDTIKIYRFAIKCPRCNNMISFRTDPQSSDYVMELGGKRNYQPTRTAETKVENVSETLERLVGEQKRLEIGNDAEDKMEVLEQRLSKLEKEQEDDQELESMKRMEGVRRIKELKLLQKPQNPDRDDKELDEIVASAFAQRHKCDSRAPKENTMRIPHKPTKIFKAKKKNPLGVTLKKR